MTKIKFTKDELKKNELGIYISELVVKAKAVWTARSRELIWVAGAVALVLVVSYVLKARKETRELEALGRYRLAVNNESSGKQVMAVEQYDYIIKNYEGTFIYGQSVLKLASKFIEKQDAANAIKVLNIGLDSGDLTGDEKIKARYMLIIAESLVAPDKTAIIADLRKFIDKFDEATVASEAKMHLADLLRGQGQAEEARSIYQEFIDKGEENPFYQDARFRLILLQSEPVEQGIQ